MPIDVCSANESGNHMVEGSLYRGVSWCACGAFLCDQGVWHPVKDFRGKGNCPCTGSYPGEGDDDETQASNGGNGGKKPSRSTRDYHRTPPARLRAGRGGR